MTILLAAGERVPVDGRVVERTVRPRLLAGLRRERAAACREPASSLQAGTLNLTDRSRSWPRRPPRTRSWPR